MLINEYCRRLSWPISTIELFCKKNISGEALKAAEGEFTLGALDAQTPLIALDERGKNLTSSQFAHLIEGYQQNASKTLAFCIGGAFGLDEMVKKRADHLISFGQMTWPHMLARVLLFEQIYRAQQILSNHPYHKE